MQLEDVEFDWNQWNLQKNEIKHGVSMIEAESVFSDPELGIYDDLKHSDEEPRWIGYGKSKLHRVLMVAFTIRAKKIRIISARTASRKEQDIYEKE
jgi:uncharacterized DUF497 family protein